MIKKEQIQKIKKLISISQTGHALEELNVLVESNFTTYSKDVIILQSKHNRIERENRLEIINNTEYSISKAKIESSILDLLSLITKDEYVSNQKNNISKENGFTKDVIKQFLEYGIDLGSIMELKVETQKNLEINHFIHFIRIEGENLIQEFEVKGSNKRNKVVSYMPFSASASIPSTKKEMLISGIDIHRNKKLATICDENDFNATKKIKLYFSSPLKKDDEFHIKCSFKLKKTILMEGKDFLLSFTSYEFDLKKYQLLVEFEQNIPDYIKLVNMNLTQELILLPDENIFTLDLDMAESNYLSNLRLLLLFDR